MLLMYDFRKMKVLFLFSHLMKTRSEAMGMRLSGNLLSSISSEKVKSSFKKFCNVAAKVYSNTEKLIVFNVSYQEL